MLVQRCTLDQHRLIIPVSITKPVFDSGEFSISVLQSRYRALVDTGAQRTVLSQSVITAQKLIRTGHMQFKGIHEPRTHTRYLAGIGFWARRTDGVISSLAYDQAEETLFSLEEPIEVVNMDDNFNFDLILGFDILKKFSFSYDSSRRSFQLTVQ